MLKEYLDRDVYNAIIKTFSFNDITEIRFRVNQNVIVVDIDANFKSIAKSEYSNYINADSSKVVVNIDEVFDIQTFTLEDTSVLQNNQYFDPHPTSFGQQYIANLFLETINNVNN